MPRRPRPLRLAAAALAGVTCALAHAQASAPAAAASASHARTTADIVREAPASAWRRPDPNDVLAMTLPSGIVWIELAPRFAPKHADNIRTLVAQHYFDGLSVLRVQDNFVAQWGDRDADDEDATKGRSLGAARRTLEPEFTVSDKGLKITPLKDRDVWAPVTGFVDGFPVAADPKAHQAWIAHCYGTIGAGRGNTVDSGNGSELYAVIGQSPRGLDRNIAPVARVLQGMELLSALPRGGGAMGFYDKPEQDTPILKVERLADMPEATRPDVRVFRTDTPQWAEMVESRRNRQDAWYVHKAGAIDLCNITVPVRIEAKAAAN